MERTNPRLPYISHGSRSLPHMGPVKRHVGASPRLSPPSQSPPDYSQNTNNHATQHDDIINFIYESWIKVTRDGEQGNSDVQYYQEAVAPRQLAHFRPFNLDEWWGRRFIQNVNRNKHRS